MYLTEMTCTVKTNWLAPSDLLSQFVTEMIEEIQMKQLHLSV